MLPALLERWVRLATRRPWLVLLAALGVTAFFGREAADRFRIRSNLSDLLPEGRQSVVDQVWVSMFAGTPGVIEPVIRAKEPQADWVEIVEGPHEGRARDLAGVERKAGGRVVLRLREPLLDKDGEAVKLELKIGRRPEDPGVPHLVGTAVQEGRKLDLRVEAPRGAALDALLAEARAGDPNGDGIFAMDVAKRGLRVIARALDALDTVEFVIWRLDLEFFEDNAVLFAEVGELKKLKCCIRWKQREAVRQEMGLGEDEGPSGPSEPGEDAGGREDDEDDDDPFAPASVGDQDPDCRGRVLDDAHCHFNGEAEGGRPSGIPEYFVSYRGYLAMFVRPIIPSSDIAGNLRTQKQVRETILRVIEEHRDDFGWAFSTDTLKLGGGYVSRAEAVKQVRNDLFSSVGLTFILLFLVILGYFRRTRALLIVLLPLVCGVLCALGITFMTVGYLNLITTFIFAVLLGLGIDFGIHIFSRYVEERVAGADLQGAMTLALQTTGVATAIGAATTALTFLALVFTSFRGFTQFGLIASIGVPLCLIFVVVLFPPLTALWESWKPGRWEKRRGRSRSRTLPWITRALGPRSAAWIVTGGVLLAAASCALLPRVQFEYDMRRVAAVNEKLDAVNKAKSGTTEGLTLSPSIAWGRDREHANRIYEVLKQAERDQPEFDSIDKVIGLRSLVPRNQPPKIALAEQIHELIRKKRDFVDNPDDRKRVEDLYERTEVSPLEAKDVPETFLRFFREKPRPLVRDLDYLRPWDTPRAVLRWLAHSGERRLGTFVFVFPRKNMWYAENAIEYAHDIGRIKVDGERLLMSSSHLIFGDLLKVVRDDGARAITFAFFSVFVLVLLGFVFAGGSRVRLPLAVLAVGLPPLGYELAVQGVLPGTDPTAAFAMAGGGVVLLALLMDRRSLAHTAIVLCPLILSFVMMLAAMPLLDWRINFFNMSVFPAILGIGVDSGVHIYHRFNEDGDGGLPGIVRYTGSAVAMASLTTAIGFGGMLNANHLGLQSIGKLAILGLALTVLNAVVFLPCLLRVLGRLGWLPGRRAGSGLRAG